MTYTKLRMLVTGGSGYLGQHLVTQARDNWEVTATYYNHPIDIPGVTWHAIDLRDKRAVEELIQSVNPAVIIHTAAANPGSNADFSTINVWGTRHIAWAAAGIGARLIHISTDVIFDGQQGDYKEEDIPSPITSYGRSKALAEAEVRKTGGAAVIVRTSLIYGFQPYIDRHSGWVLEGIRIGTPVRLFNDELRNPVWVKSLVDALLELARHSYIGVLNIAGDQVLSRYEFGTRMVRYHGENPKPIIPASSQASGMNRPLNCSLDLTLAKALLKTPLPGVDKVIARLQNSP
ncbi:MAG: SDR family oxidoreductase [Anaerolineae bacterium]|nr:SDR family oxidoreductase [Anaerolineae bacterium]